MLGQTTNPVDPVTALIGVGGIVGIFFALGLLDWIELRPSIIRRDNREKQQQALIDTLLAVYHHEVLPTLGDYEKRLSPLLKAVEDRLEELEWITRNLGGGGENAPTQGSPPRRRNQGGTRSS